LKLAQPHGAAILTLQLWTLSMSNPLLLYNYYASPFGSTLNYAAHTIIITLRFESGILTPLFKGMKYRKNSNSKLQEYFAGSRLYFDSAT